MKGIRKAIRQAFIPATLVIAILVILVVPLSGCGKPAGAFKGTVKESGSTTVLPIAQEAAVELGNRKNGANVQVQGGGSSVGIAQLKERIVQIAMSSRELNAGENPGTFVDHKIAFDIIAIAVNPSLKITNLTSAQAKGIFTGRVTNWSEVGGPDRDIVVVVRDQASGTREIFDQKVLGSTSEKPVESEGSAIECASNGVVRETIGVTDNAIGYLSVGYINKLVKPVSYNGVPPRRGRRVERRVSDRPLPPHVHERARHGHHQGVRGLRALRQVPERDRGAGIHPDQNRVGGGEVGWRNRSLSSSGERDT